MNSLMRRVIPKHRREDAEIKSLAERIVTTAEHQQSVAITSLSIHRIRPDESDQEVIHRFNEALCELRDAVRDAVADHDLDALRAYAKINIDSNAHKVRTLQRVIKDLRHAGHQETAPLINEEVLIRAAMVWLDIFDEGFDERTSLYRSGLAGDDRNSCIRALRVACLVAPHEVIEYLTSDTTRAMNLVGDRRIRDHEEITRVVLTFINSETPALADGLL